MTGGAGEIVSHAEMCSRERRMLQQGMNFRRLNQRSVILMSTRKGAPYADRVEENGRVLVYEGHNVARRQGGPDPRSVDQPERYQGGTLTQNGLFAAAAEDFKRGARPAERVWVYEKLREGVWVFNGVFLLEDVWREQQDGRQVYKFRFVMDDSGLIPEQLSADNGSGALDLTRNRLIPSAVKQEVWKRDHGRCVTCGSADNLHFDHVVPFSKGGSSLVAVNIQLLCARHNLGKSARIE